MRWFLFKNLNDLPRFYAFNRNKVSPVFPFRGRHKNPLVIITVEVVKRSRCFSLKYTTHKHTRVGPVVRVVAVLAAVSTEVERRKRTTKNKKKILKRLHSQGGAGNLPCKSSTDKLLAICERINQHLLFWPPFLTPLIWLLYIPRDRYADEAPSKLLSYLFFILFYFFLFHSFLSVEVVGFGLVFYFTFEGLWASLGL